MRRTREREGGDSALSSGGLHPPTVECWSERATRTAKGAMATKPSGAASNRSVAGLYNSTVGKSWLQACRPAICASATSMSPWLWPAACSE